MAHRRLPKTCYHSPKGRAETGAPLPLNKLLLGAKQVPIRKELPWHTTPQKALRITSRFQMQVTERTKGTFSPMHVKYSLALKMGSSSFETTFQSNPNVHGEPTVTQVFGALASDAMLARDYGMDEFADELCADIKPSEAIRSYNSCKDTYNWMRDSLHLSNGDIASLSEVIGENESEVGALVEQAASERAARHAYDHPKLPKGFVTIEQLQGDLDLGELRDEVEDFDFDGAHHDGRVSVEMRQLTDEGERLWGQLDYEDYLPIEGLTAMGKHYELGDEKQFIHDLYNSPELCAAPRYMEQSFGCPSEEYEKEEVTLPHDFTTGKWRVHLIYPGERYGLDGCLTYELNAYSGAPAAVHRASYPLVEFYDTSQDAARFPGGQFVSRYYMTDLLEDDSIAVSIDTMLKNGNQFSLDGGIPAWTVEGDDLAKVNDFLKKSCMEFCGSLPGDDRGEDGYSLSGEARDAATSRNGLNENRKSVAEMIQECFDSIENNGDAI